jgi:hypothetical protein
MAAMAEAPEKVKVIVYHAKSQKIYKTVADGEFAYVTSNDDLTVSDWTDTATAPEDKFMKFEYDVESATLKVTMKNFKADMTTAGGYTCHGLEFPVGEYTVAMELIGENLLHHGKSSCIKTNNDGGLTITGTEGSSLTLNMGQNSTDAYGSATATLWMMKGDLTIKNTTLNFNVFTSTSSMHHCIATCGGNVLMEGVTVNHKANNGGHLVFMADGTVKDSRDIRSTMDKNPERKITVKDCKIVSDGHGGLFRSMSPVTLINTELKATTGSAPLFSGESKLPNAPVIEGEFSAAAGLKKNAEKQDKWKAYEPKKLKDYTFLYIVPGKVELVPTEETEPETQAPTIEETVAPTIEETVAPTTEATTPVNKNEATQPTTGDKNEATKPADKDDNKTDKGEEKSGSPLKVILIILIALVVLGGGAVAVILILRNRNAEVEEDEEEEEEEESEEETEE